MNEFIYTAYQEERESAEALLKDWRTLFRAQKRGAGLLFCVAILLGLSIAFQAILLGRGVDVLISARSVRTVTSELATFLSVQVVFVVALGLCLRLRSSLTGVAKSSVDELGARLAMLSLGLWSLAISPVFVPIMAIVSYVGARSGKWWGMAIGVIVTSSLYLAFFHRLVDSALYLDRTLGEAIQLLIILSVFVLFLLRLRRET